MVYFIYNIVGDLITHYRFLLMTNDC